MVANVDRWMLMGGTFDIACSASSAPSTAGLRVGGERGLGGEVSGCTLLGPEGPDAGFGASSDAGVVHHPSDHHEPAERCGVVGPTVC